MHPRRCLPLVRSAVHFALQDRDRTCEAWMSTFTPNRDQCAHRCFDLRRSGKLPMGRSLCPDADQEAGQETIAPVEGSSGPSQGVFRLRATRAPSCRAPFVPLVPSCKSPHSGSGCRSTTAVDETRELARMDCPPGLLVRLHRAAGSARFIRLPGKVSSGGHP